MPVTLGSLEIGTKNPTKAEYEQLVEVLQKDYSDVISDDLKGRTMAGPPMTITFRPGMKVIPHCVSTTKQIPIHQREQALAQVQEMLDDEIIEKVDHPTEWCASAFFVSKGPDTKKLRFVTDFSELNKYILREITPFAASMDVVRMIPKSGHNCYLSMDMLSGYHQVELAEDAKDLTTFLLFNSRYRYRKSPMGLSGSSDFFLKKSDAALTGTQEYCAKLVDDLLIHAPDIQELELRARSVLDKLRAASIVVSKKKMKASSEVKFAGFIISPVGIKPDPDRISALLNLEPPKNLKALRGWLGAVQQLNPFHHQIANFLHENVQLTKKDVAFVWTDKHQKAFEKTKEVLRSHLELTFHDPKQPTFLLSDASYFGMGFLICQAASWDKVDPKTKLRLPKTYNIIMAASRSLTSAECNYSVTELEMCGVCWAMQKADYYVQGAPDLRIITDHKALETLLNKKSLSSMPSQRLLRLRMRLTDYQFTVQFCPGRFHYLPDWLSRYPEMSPKPEDETMINSIECDTKARDDKVTSGDRALEKLLQRARTDTDYVRLLKRVQERNQPREASGDEYLTSFLPVWDDLSVLGDLVLFNDKIVIPENSTKQICKLLHRSHHQTDKTLAAARARYYWPRMKAQVMSECKSCVECVKYLPTQQREPQINDMAERPFQKLGADVLSVGKHKYLIVVDRYASFVWPIPLKDERTMTVIRALEELMTTCCFSPETLRMDSGTNFRSREFADFAARWNITLEFSSPHYKVSNGLAEASCKRVRYLLEKHDGRFDSDFRQALNTFRNTPLLMSGRNQPGPSPVQLLYGRATADPHLPALPSYYDPIDVDEADRFRKDVCLERKKVKDENAREMSLLRPHQRVAIQDPVTHRWTKFGSISHLRETGSGRSYIVKCDDGGELERNRRLLRPLGKTGIFKKVHFAKPEVTKLHKYQVSQE